MKKLSFFKSITLLGAILLSLNSCEKNELFDDTTEVENAEVSTIPKTVYGSRSIFFTWADGAYSSSRLISDFGNDAGTIDAGEYGRLSILNNELKVKLPANTVGNDSGIWSKVDITYANKYSLEYRVKFGAGFQWAHGGKIPGLAGGKAYSGCTGDILKANKDGWSFRPMWHQWTTVNGGNAYIDPYLYHLGMPSTCGDSFNALKTVTLNTWYTVKLVVQMNTGSNADGRAELYLNGSPIINRGDIKFVTVDSGRNVRYLMLDVFRGGADSNYMSSTTDYIYVDNMILTKY